MNIPPLGRGRAQALVDRFHGQRVLVVGDVMVDRFILGTVHRISAEAPVPVVRFQSEHIRLGGAGNVAHNLQALGASVALVGIVGTDTTAARLREHLRQSGLSDAGLVADATRPTIEKVRVVTSRNQQVARLDYEDDSDPSPEIQAAVVDAVRQHASDVRVLLVSDYLKGTITAPVMRTLTEMKEGRPLLVDPKIPHLDFYAGATLITPNHHEAEAATHRWIRTDEDAKSGAAAFRDRARCDAALITRGEQGMWLSSAESEGAIPSVARQVADVTGAGDTVIATVALALAAGATIAEASVLANHAAGVVVGKFGTATVSPEELLAAI